MGIVTWKSDFTSGEISPLLSGQTNLKRYASGASELENWVVHVQGGATRRAGTAFVAYTRGGRSAKLIPFVFNQDQAYVLEFTGQCIRIFTNRAPLVTADSSPSTTLTLSAQSGLIVATTGTAVFDPVTEKDIGRTISVPSGGRGTVYEVLSTTQARVAVLVDFETTSFGSGVWSISGLPIEITTPYTSGEIFELRTAQSADTMYIVHPNHAPRKLIRSGALEWSLLEVGFNPPPVLEFGDQPDLTLTLNAATGTTTATLSGGYFLAADAGRVLSGKGGSAVISSVSSATQAVIDIITTFPDLELEPGEWRLEGSPVAQINTNEKEPKGRLVNLTLDQPGWRSNDVGKYVHAIGGSAKIVAVPGSTLAQAQIIRPFDRAGASPEDGDPAGAWTLNEPAWSQRFGYPGVITLHQQRLWAFGTKHNPLSFWASDTGNFEAFTVGPDNDNSIARTIASPRIDIIRWVKGTEHLYAGTIGSEFKIHSGDEEFTPANCQVDAIGTEGSAYGPDSYQHNNVILFIDRSRRVIREFWFNAETGLYMAVDLGKVAEHLFRDPLLMVTMVRAPEPYILAISANGRLLCCAYDRAEQVVGWTPFATQGTFKDVCVIPSDCGDEVWVVAERGGKFMVEFFDGQLRLDSSVFYSGALVEGLRGLIHLEGREVQVLGDGVRVEETTVQDGEVSHTAASTVQAGLRFSIKAKSLPVEAQTGKGSLQGRKKKYTDLTLRLLCTEALTFDGLPRSLIVNGEDLAHSGQIDKVAPGAAFTGDMRREMPWGWDRQGVHTIECHYPIRATIVGIGGNVEIED